MNQGVLQWRVKEKVFTWERPLRRADHQVLGDAAPDGDILAVWVDDVGVKEALLSDDPDVFFTTPHFDGYAIVLIRLEKIPVPELEELIIEAWLDRAPKRTVSEYLKASEYGRDFRPSSHATPSPSLSARISSSAKASRSSPGRAWKRPGSPPTSLRLAMASRPRGANSLASILDPAVAPGTCGTPRDPTVALEANPHRDPTPRTGSGQQHRCEGPAPGKIDGYRRHIDTEYFHATKGEPDRQLATPGGDF